MTMLTGMKTSPPVSRPSLLRRQERVVDSSSESNSSCGVVINNSGAGNNSSSDSPLASLPPSSAVIAQQPPLTMTSVPSTVPRSDSILNRCSDSLHRIAVAYLDYSTNTTSSSSINSKSDKMVIDQSATTISSPRDTTLSRKRTYSESCRHSSSGDISPFEFKDDEKSSHQQQPSKRRSGGVVMESIDDDMSTLTALTDENQQQESRSSLLPPPLNGELSSPLSSVLSITDDLVDINNVAVTDTVSAAAAHYHDDNAVVEQEQQWQEEEDFNDDEQQQREIYNLATTNRDSGHRPGYDGDDRNSITESVWRFNRMYGDKSRFTSLDSFLRNGFSLWDYWRDEDQDGNDELKEEEKEHRKKISGGGITTTAAAVTSAALITAASKKTRERALMHAKLFDNLFGIPKLCKFFEVFDPINSDETFARVEVPRADGIKADYVEISHALDYMTLLDDKETRIRLLRSARSEPLIHALFAFLLRWSSDSLLNFVDMFPRYGFLRQLDEDIRSGDVFLYRAAIDCLPLAANKSGSDGNNHHIYYCDDNKYDYDDADYHHYRQHQQQHDYCLCPSDGSNDILFVRCAYKYVKKWHEYLLRHDRDLTEYQEGNFRNSGEYRIFSLRNVRVFDELRVHAREVYRWIMQETFDEDRRRAVEDWDAFPNEFFARRVNGGSGGRWVRLSYPANAMRVITGQACCGKTTLSRGLQAHGYHMLSRGDIGSFAGKARSPATVAGLHAAMEYVFRMPGIVGDRGPIDNPLWTRIMELCDSRVTSEREIVDRLFDFVEENFNENSIRYFSRTQRCVVFIDPLPSRNRSRMLRRGTGGDAHRARIRNYAPVQAIAYYVMARVFGWRVFCVPYDYSTPERRYAVERYNDILGEILKFFGASGYADEHEYEAEDEVDRVRQISNRRPDNRRTIEIPITPAAAVAAAMTTTRGADSSSVSPSRPATTTTMAEIVAAAMAAATTDTTMTTVAKVVTSDALLEYAKASGIFK